MGNPELDKEKLVMQELYPLVWPSRQTQAVETRPNPRFRGFVEEVGGAFAPPIFVRSSPLGFAYKY